VANQPAVVKRQGSRTKTRDRPTRASLLHQLAECGRCFRRPSTTSRKRPI
jgi:hypothetical protein